MTLKADFVEDMNGAPLELQEFAELAILVTDCEDLRGAAERYLEAKSEFEQALKQHNVEVG